MAASHNYVKMRILAQFVLCQVHSLAVTLFGGQLVNSSCSVKVSFLRGP